MVYLQEVLEESEELQLSKFVVVEVVENGSDVEQVKHLRIKGNKYSSNRKIIDECWVTLEQSLPVDKRQRGCQIQI